ncbi:DUF418 domain-containing protein [Streptomyces lichenis]|uniref:DUF418 domain-containing protein n=1 Tax=Streptomyces lichenis TaxID=2306967 RepID=A0ABT0IA49_9ACTN|nr:DUF418 domain-containing protein [Streptomyces lichenis]MCK8678200.1 DUF418 domain-containing protein [Streptomyces lichenis]
MAEPPGPAVRAGSPDVLRGFALLGILVVNARVLGGVPAPRPEGMSPDRLAALAVGTLAEAKFYLLFCFLFGYSTALLTRRAAPPPYRSHTARYLRRLGALSVLGAGHAVLLFAGDILTLYAVLGLLLYPLHRLRPRTLCLLGCGLLASFSLLMLAYGQAALATGPVTADPPAGAALAELAARHRDGPAGAIGARLEQLPLFAAGNAMYAPQVLAGMLLGLAAGKAGWLERTWPRARLYRLAAAGLLVGLPGSGFMALCSYGPLPPHWAVLGRAVGVCTASALTGAYICLLLARERSGVGRRVDGLLTPAGRMALTHYLTQSLVLALVFTGYGLGWYGRIGGAPVLAGCLLLFAAQLRLGEAYLRRFDRGPAEALVRRISLGPLHRRRPADAKGAVSHR